MCNEVIVLSLILDLQFEREWMSFAVTFFCNIYLYFPENKLKETLQDLISEPESDENTILIHETQQKIETLETKVIYNSIKF